MEGLTGNEVRVEVIQYNGRAKFSAIIKPQN
jgi:hypothetical protein